MPDRDHPGEKGIQAIVIFVIVIIITRNESSQSRDQGQDPTARVRWR